MSNGLVCKDLYKNYKKTEVLKGLDLQLEKGKIYGLIGRNGAEHVLDIPLNDDEMRSLKHSAKTLSDLAKTLELPVMA
jgi:malate/lactate dehydrogenase